MILFQIVTNVEKNVMNIQIVIMTHVIYCLFNVRIVKKNMMDVVAKNVMKFIPCLLKNKENLDRGKKIVIKFLKKVDLKRLLLIKFNIA